MSEDKAKVTVQSIKAARGSGRGTVGIVDQLPESDLVDLAFLHGHHHLVQKSQPGTMREIRLARLMSQKIETFLDYPISSTLKPRSAGPPAETDLTLQEWSLTQHADKQRILTGIGEIFDQSNLNASLRGDVVQTADELICNVLFNASQKDGVNKKEFPEAMKEAREKLRYPATVRIGAYGGFVAVSCRDSYGTLVPKRVLERIHLCLRDGAGSAINLGSQGTAGIGTYLVFSACTTLVMGVKENVASQVCALFSLRSRSKLHNIKNKNLHWRHIPKK